jgi:hypothetical protein
MGKNLSDYVAKQISKSRQTQCTEHANTLHLLLGMKEAVEGLII